jgi:hypothetical protein
MGWRRQGKAYTDSILFLMRRDALRQKLPHYSPPFIVALDEMLLCSTRARLTSSLNRNLLSFPPCLSTTFQACVIRTSGYVLVY